MAIGIIGAMETEIEALTKREMEAGETIEKAGMVFHAGRLGSRDVVVVRSGIGKVNAAICAQILVDCFGITHLINTGIAGSLDKRIGIGDIVVSTDAVQHDMDLSPLGFERGEIPRLDAPVVLREFPADPLLREAAAAACREAAPGSRVFEGRIVSGDQFICGTQQKTFLAESFGALCTEMEGAAIAHTAYVNKVPFVIVRAISDSADEKANVSFAEFERRAAKTCAGIVAHMVRSLK